MPKKSETTNPKYNIIIEGANMHNLKNVHCVIPKNSFVVITGLSGSGKSSLAFDTLYAEGQRRYVESLSSYARQFLGRIDKPDVANIDGITPAIAIEQKVSSTNPRSTVGTVTEIYDYIKLLFARIGKTYSPISGKQVKRDNVESIIQHLLAENINKKCTVFANVSTTGYKNLSTFLENLISQGFVRIVWKGEIKKMEEILHEHINEKLPNNIEVLIDRFTVTQDEENVSRIYDSIQTAFFESQGTCILEIEGSKKTTFNNKFELDGMVFQEPNIHFFSFNNPLGACKTCEGFGHVIGIDEDLVIPNPSLSVFDDAVACWKGEKLSEWKDEFIKNAHKFDFPVHKPYLELSSEMKHVLWHGNKYVAGIWSFFKMLEENLYKIQYRVMLSRYRGRTICHECEGSRLRKETNYVKINNINISQLLTMPCDELLIFFENITLSEYEKQVSNRVLIEITNRLKYICNVGLGYLNLNRPSATLSGGESQRIQLARSLGSSLVGSTYILDEPSIGLHPRDGNKLIQVLKDLKNLGNTVIVVEHDEEMMKNADLILDLGPKAGSEGGEIVFSGTYHTLKEAKNSLTADYLLGRKSIEIPKTRRKWKYFIEIEGARENNLKNIAVKFPLQVLTVITGVSGSGKSTLVKEILFPYLQKKYKGIEDGKGKFTKISGDFHVLHDVEYVDQNPMGRTSRSNPVTYVKAFDEIRLLFSNQHLAKLRGYKPAYFSFNVSGGRCDKCEGEGSITIEMQFMADVVLECEVCKGKRYKEEILEVEYKGKNISDILQMTVDDAQDFFITANTNEKNSQEKTLLQKIIQKLEPIQKVGLGYLQLGQSSSTLSGGEAQRIKLATYLVKGNMQENKKILFIFDEPSTGLHFYDVDKLLQALDELIQLGHSVILIEHHLDIIKYADWVIDIGPEGGKNGGEIIFEGIPEDLCHISNSYTAKFLKEKF